MGRSLTGRTRSDVGAVGRQADTSSGQAPLIEPCCQDRNFL